MHLRLGKHDVGLLRRRGIDFPVQDPASERNQQFLLFAALWQEHHHADVGTRKMLYQAGQKLDFMVRQSGGVVHDPNLGRRNRHIGFHGLLHGVVTQCRVEAGQQGLGAGGEIDLNPDLRGHRAQTLDQNFAVVVQYGLMAAQQGQAHAVLGDCGDHPFQAQHIRSAEQQGRAAVELFGAGSQGRSHWTAPGTKGLPSVSNNIASGILGVGRAIGSTPGCTRARPKT